MPLHDYICDTCQIIVQDKWEVEPCPECGSPLRIAFINVPTFKIFQLSRVGSDDKTLHRASASEDPLVLQELGMMEGRYKVLPDEATKELREEYKSCRTDIDKCDFRDKVISLRKKKKEERRKCPTTSKKLKVSVM